MISIRFPSIELCSYGVGLPGRNETLRLKPNCLDRRFQEILQQLGYDLNAEVKIYQPDSQTFDDTWTVEQREQGVSL